MRPSPIRWGNVTVPYTALWSAEVERRAPKIVHVKMVGHRLAMLSEGVSLQEGKPVFSKLHADRCREVVRQELCQMCLTPLPCTIITVNQGQEDRFRPLINDGLPMCPKCALEALDACPGMQRQTTNGSLRLWASRRGDWILAPVLLGVVPERLGGNAKTNRLLEQAGGPVFTGPKLVLKSWKRISRSDIEGMIT